MLTDFGKNLRKLRIDTNELLKDMASRLGVTPAYLSSIENGKRNPTKELLSKILLSYELSAEQITELEDSFAKAVNEISIDMSSTNQYQSELGLVFARKISSLSDDQINMIKSILSNNEEGTHD